MKRRASALASVAVAIASVLAMVVVGPAGSAGAAGEPGTFHPVAPVRLLDTRIGLGAAKAAVPGHGAVSFLVAGRGGVPATGAGAVALNVTVTGPQAGGYLTVWPHGAARPTASVLNFATAQTVANSATVLLPGNGSLDVYNGSAGSVQVVVDVSGYVTAGAATAAGGLVPLPPARVLDTRSGIGGTVGPVAAGGTVLLHVAGAGGVPPAGVSAVLLNLTVTAPTGPGYLVAWDGGPVVPGTSNLNFVAGQTVANQAVVPVGPDGGIGIRNVSASGSTVQVIADVAGYVLAGTPQLAGTFQALAPARILDTRNLNNARSSVPGGGSLSLFVGEAGVPVSGVDAVALHVTVTNTGSSGYLTVYPSGAPRPTASNLNWRPGQTVSNLVFAPVGADGRVVLTNASSSSVNVIADVVGYVRGQSPAPMATIDVYAGAGKCSPTDRQHPCLINPLQVALDPAGDVYVADDFGGLREITTDGVVHTVVPGPGSIETCARTGDGGPASAGCVNATGVTRAASGDLYISDGVNGRLRKIGTDGVISTVAGTGDRRNCGDGGPAIDACLAPVSSAADATGRLYVTDAINDNIRRIDLDGTISTVVGKVWTSGVPEFCPQTQDGLPATEVCLGMPYDIIFDPAGNLYLTEFRPTDIGGSSAYRVRMVDTSGVIHTVAGAQVFGFCGDGGPATAACLPMLKGIGFDPAGNLLVSADGRIRQVDPAGTIITIAGHGPTAPCGTGIPAPAACLASDRFAIDATGRTYVADPTNKRIWVLTPPAP